MTRAAAAFTIIAVLLIAACGKKNDGEGDTESAAPVQVAVAKQGPIESTISAEAVLYPIQQANVVPKISAPVAAFYVQRGDRVHKGQLLAALESKDLQASAKEAQEQYRQARAAYDIAVNATVPGDLLKAKTDFASAEEALKAAQAVYDNRVKLYQQGAIAHKLVDDAAVTLAQTQAQYATAKQALTSAESVGREAQLKTAKAQVDAAQAHYASIDAQAQYAEVRSPISGIVSDRPLNIGDIAGAGSVLMSIVDNSKISARASVPINESARIHVGDAVTFNIGDGVKGKITVVSPSTDPSTTTVQVWAEALNPDGALKPGATVQMTVDAGQIPNAVLVPAAAILASDDGGEKVMIAGTDGLAHERSVDVGIRNADVAQITNGVKPGEQVIVEGAVGLDDKAKIEIAKPGAAGDEDNGK